MVLVPGPATDRDGLDAVLPVRPADYTLHVFNRRKTAATLPRDVRPLALALLCVACAPAPPPPIATFPEPAELPERTKLPTLFDSFTDSQVARTRTEWTGWRRSQLVALFDHYVYGVRPPKVAVTATTTATLEGVVPGATWEEVDLTFDGNPAAVLHLAVIRPHGVTKPPVVVGLNKCGNHSLVADARVRGSTSAIIAPCGGTTVETTRGVQTSLWPLAELVARGVAVVTFHESDAAPDDDTRFASGLRAQFRPAGEGRTVWGTLSIWAWALAHVGDWVDSLPEFDARRTAVFGHSRRGKASLLSGLETDAFDAVIAHQSGTGGAALNRSLEGEPLELINLTFPHWFNDVYPGFANAELRTPVDQHQLIALWAPRRVVLVDGDDDRWADPDGAKAAAEAASPAWQLFGNTGVGAELTWQSRPGGHSVDVDDWALFLDALAW